MRYAGLVIFSFISSVSFPLVLGLASICTSGCGESTPTPTAEEIKGSRLNRLVNERVEKQIAADQNKKEKKARGKK